MSIQTDTDSASRSGWGLVGRWLREIGIVVIGALIASTLLRLFVVQMFVIPSLSMENTLLVKDRVAVQKLVGFQRGDVVVFRDSLDWLNEDKPKEDAIQRALVFIGLAPDEAVGHLVKRVVGVAGDHVTCCDADGRVSVNGVALDESEYLYIDPATGRQVGPSNFPFDVVVPAGTIFVMGDHRDRSFDSRCHLSDDSGSSPAGSRAFIPVTDVVGSAVAVVFPLNNFHALSRPRAFENIPDGSPPPSAPILNGTQAKC